MPIIQIMDNGVRNCELRLSRKWCLNGVRNCELRLSRWPHSAGAKRRNKQFLTPVLFSSAATPEVEMPIIHTFRLANVSQLCS